MENKYLTRKDLLLRPNWDLTKVQNFPHDQIKKSETGRGRPSYLYLQSRVEAFERGEIIAPEALPVVAKGNELEARLDRALTKADKPDKPVTSKSINIHASVFNEGPKRVSVVPTTRVDEGSAAFVPKHSPLKFEPTPKGLKPTIKLVVIDSEGKETLVQTPIIG